MSRETIEEKSIWDIDYVIVDFETTGSLPSIDSILEVGAVVFSKGRIVDSFSSLVYPGRSIPPFITFLTGITQEMIKTAPLPSEIIPKLMEFIKGKVFVAHNAKFDLGFLNSQLMKLGMPPYDGDVLCTLQLARRLLKLPRRGLDSLIEYFGINISHRHRALYDAEATALILNRLLKLLNNEGIYTWRELLKKINGEYDIPPNFLRLKSILEYLPHTPGVILFLDELGDVLYITKSKDIKNKLSNYFYIQDNAPKNRKELLKNTYSLEYIVTSTEFEAYLLEKELLQILEPRLNKVSRKRINNQTQTFS